jgi:hypothetical protein
MKKFTGIILILAFFSALSCSLYRESKLKKEGAAIIEKIETFKAGNARLPESLSDLGLKDAEEGPIYYRKTSDSSYEIWFGAELGESVTYRSQSKAWNR